MKYSEVDWVHYLSRPKEFLFSNLLVTRFKGTELKKVTGYGYLHWLFLNNGENTMGLYYNAKEVRLCDAGFRKMIKDEGKLKEFFSRGKVEIEKTRDMIKQYRSKTITVDLSSLKEEYLQAVKQLIDYFVYAIEIPYCVGTVFRER